MPVAEPESLHAEATSNVRRRLRRSTLARGARSQSRNLRRQRRSPTGLSGLDRPKVSRTPRSGKQLTTWRKRRSQAPALSISARKPNRRFTFNGEDGPALSTSVQRSSVCPLFLVRAARRRRDARAQQPGGVGRAARRRKVSRETHKNSGATMKSCLISKYYMCLPYVRRDRDLGHRFKLV